MSHSSSFFKNLQLPTSYTQSCHWTLFVNTDGTFYENPQFALSQCISKCGPKTRLCVFAFPSLQEISLSLIQSLYESQLRLSCSLNDQKFNSWSIRPFTSQRSLLSPDSSYLLPLSLSNKVIKYRKNKFKKIAGLPLWPRMAMKPEDGRHRYPLG